MPLPAKLNCPSTALSYTVISSRRQPRHQHISHLTTLHRHTPPPHTHTHTHTHAHTCTYTHMHTHAHTHVHTCTHALAHTHTHTPTHTHTRTHVRGCSCPLSSISCTRTTLSFVGHDPGFKRCGLVGAMAG